jgi:hypothetical protein
MLANLFAMLTLFLGGFPASNKNKGKTRARTSQKILYCTILAISKWIRKGGQTGDF